MSGSDNYSLVKIADNVRRVDGIIRTSPTAQALVANAPQLLQYFKEMQAVGQQQRFALQALAVNRQYDLEKFKAISGQLVAELKDIRMTIGALQEYVRSKANEFSSDANARTIIEYTERQISQNIQMFNSILYVLLNK